MNNHFRSQKQAIIAAAAFILVIMLATAGAIFALTSSKADKPQVPPPATEQSDPDDQTEPTDQKYETEPAEHGAAWNIITLDEAKAIALKDAGLEESAVKFYNVKLTQDDGIEIYEIEFYYQGAEYEYEIDAETGAITDRDIDYDDDGDDDD